MRQDQSAIKKNNQRDCSKNENMIGLPSPPPNVEGLEDKVEEVTQEGEEQRHGKWKKR